MAEHERAQGAPCALQNRLAGTSDPLFPASKEIAAVRRAGTALYHYTVAAAGHDDVSAARYQTKVRELVPEVVLAAGAADSTKSTVAPQRELVELLKQQEVLRQQLEEDRKSVV